jgi:hypothetical protein
MSSEHHDLDIHPIPKEKMPMFINEPWLVDRYLFDYGPRNKEPELEDDNIRIYVPIDLNKESILRRLRYIIVEFEEANEDNEMSFSAYVRQLICQIEIYDQIWYVRHIPKEGRHSKEAKELVKEFVGILKEIPDGCAEMFPFEMIDELEAEYLH